MPIGTYDARDAAELIRLWFTVPMVEDANDLESVLPFHDPKSIKAAIAQLKLSRELLPVEDKDNGLYIADGARGALAARFTDPDYCRAWLERLQAEQRYLADEWRLPPDHPSMAGLNLLMELIEANAEDAGVVPFPERTAADDATALAAQRRELTGAAPAVPDKSLDELLGASVAAAQPAEDSADVMPTSDLRKRRCRTTPPRKARVSDKHCEKLLKLAAGVSELQTTPAEVDRQIAQRMSDDSGGKIVFMHPAFARRRRYRRERREP